MSLRPTPSDPIGHVPSDDSARLLDLLHGGLAPSDERALRARLAAEPALARELAALERLVRASQSMLLEPGDPALARRLALRVRDQVAHEEQAERRAADRAPSRWSSRTFARVLLASLAVHVVVLGWVLLREPSPAPERVRPPMGVAVHGPEVRDPAVLEELAAPPELGPIVAAELVPDQLLERRGLELPDDLGAEPRHVPEPAMRVAEHPWPVQYDMLARSRAGVRRGRLVRAGVEASEALTRIEKGLQALAARQLASGAFPADLTVPESERAPYNGAGRTALALLPFLAEGRCSVPAPGGPADTVVARGVSWLLEPETAEDVLVTHSRPADLALVILAVSEDYMLAYGRFEPAAAVQRAGKIAWLVEGLASQQAADGSFPGEGAERLWPLLALDAVAHTGIVSGAQQSLTRLARWFDSLPRSADGVPLGADGRPDAALAAGRMVAARGLGAPAAAATGESANVLLASAAAPDLSPASLTAGLALYRGHPAAFGVWNRTQAAAQAARLSPAGVVLRGDPVADTALVLLALQSAYRAY